MIELLERHKSFVAFVGAGASALAPSNLPTWTEFNTLLLECLCEGLGDYSGYRQPTADMLSLFRARREGTHFFAPDFQAQLMEEEVGLDYFRVWQSIDTNIYGPVHAGLAELASKGRLAAIITTNFDRLIEGALRDRGHRFEVFHDRALFELLQKLGTDTPAPLPVIKIHGSIEDASSLVDTLKQRLVGRPESLTQGIRILLQKYPWLYLGFSGADFSYDRRYLGILDAADDAKGFVFVAREIASVLDGVRLLVQAYGTEKASVVQGDLSTWLSGNFQLSAPCTSSTPSIGGREAALSRVKERILQWSNSVGDVAVVNILCSLLKSSGMAAQAFWLLRKTWKSYRTARDTRGKSYARYNYNYGMTLLETGFIGNPIRLADDKSNLPEWKEHADEDAGQFFVRSYTEGKLLPAGAQMACVLAYRGRVGEAIALASTVTEEALDRNARLELCDVAIACTVIYDIVRLFDPASKQLRNCLEIARELGDEPRRGALCAQLGRFLTYGGHFAEADEFLAEAERIGRRLDLQAVSLASQAARGRWLADSAQPGDGSVRMLRQVVEAIKMSDDVPLYSKVDPLQPESTPRLVKGRHPALCRVLLDLNRAALFLGDSEVIDQTFDQLDKLTLELYLGYRPHYYLAYAEALLTHGVADKRGLIGDLIGGARQAGERSKNPWVAGAADRLESMIHNGKRQTEAPLD